jgi:hypothetical protein
MLVITLAVAVLFAGVATPLHAGKFFCSSGDVTCLIGAINSANAGPGKHIINLEPGIYTLHITDNDTDGPNGLPSITRNLTIRGGSPGGTVIQRDVNATTFRIFHVAVGAMVTLDALVLTQGRTRHGGGGLLNLGTVTITNSVLERNVADEFGGGGIENHGTLAITGSSVFNNTGFHRVGGISNDGGLVTIRDTTITNNGGDRTGGILNSSGETVIVNTTIANNVGVGVGGIRNILGLVRITNGTIVGNSSFGAVFFPHTGGVANDVQNSDSMILQNTILATNTSARSDADGGPDCDGEITSLGNNLFGDLLGCTVELKSGDFIGDPKLGQFTDNGDPGLGHFPLLSDSPAIDGANLAACPQTDQLGFFRAATCDIGAVEFQPTPLNVVLDFQPNDPKNTVNPSKDNSQVAILSSTSFDARAIDPDTMGFGPNQILDIDGKGRFKDVNGDGLQDLILRFSVAESGIQCGDSSVSISGETFNGQAIQASDFIKTVGCKIK